jgi:hypothetical protein
LRRVVSLGNFGKSDAGRPNFQSPLVTKVPFGITAFTVTRAPMSGGWQPRMLRPQSRSRWLELKNLSPSHKLPCDTTTATVYRRSG